MSKPSVAFPLYTPLEVAKEDCQRIIDLADTLRYAILGAAHAPQHDQQDPPATWGAALPTFAQAITEQLCELLNELEKLEKPAKERGAGARHLAPMKGRKDEQAQTSK